MTDENWQAKYNTMRIFYEDRIKHLDEMLAKSMDMNAQLVAMLRDTTDKNYLPRKTPFKDEQTHPWKAWKANEEK